MKYISMISGGQDSTAMTLRLLELGYPLDYIVFSDTTLEFDEMYEYIDKLDAFFQRKYGINITKLKPRDSYESWVFGDVSSGDNQGTIRGTPRITEMCYWRREAKEYPFTRWLKQQGIKKYKIYVGYTFREYDRWKNIDKYNAIAPLVEWKWNEPDVQAYLKDNMMENKLYQHFERTGCAICQKQSMASKYNVYKYYNHQWEYMKKIENKLIQEKKNRNESISPCFSTDMFCEDMEKLFKKKDKQATFDFDFEPIQDCFCKI